MRELSADRGDVVASTARRSIAAADVQDGMIPGDERGLDVGEPWPRLPTSARRYPSQPGATRPPAAPQQTIIQTRYRDLRGNPIPKRSGQPRTTEDAIQATPALMPAPARGRWHPLVYIGGTFAVMVFGYLSISAIENWWNGMQDDWHYGTPRTFQTNARVGHSDKEIPTHFIAENNGHGRFYVIEVQGSDPAYTQIYVVGPTLQGDGSDQAPITLSFEDVNHDGRPDMIVEVNDTCYVYINATIDGKDTFRAARPEDHVDA